MRVVCLAVLLGAPPLLACSLLFDTRTADQIEIDGGEAVLDAGLEGLGPLRTLTSGAGHATYSSVVWDGSNYRVVWEDGGEVVSGEVYATTVGSDNIVRITTTGGTKPSSVWNGTSLAIAWVDDRDNPALYAGYYDQNNQLIGSESLVSEGLGGIAQVSSLVATSTQVGVTWFESAPSPQVAFARLDGAGALVESPVIVHPMAAVPTIAFNGSHYGVTWHDSSGPNIFIQQYLPSGQKSGQVTQVSFSADDSLLPVIASNGSDFAVVWQETSNSSLHFVQSPEYGKMQASVPITTGDAVPSLPDMVWNGEGYGVIWQDDRGGQSEIYFREFDSAGAPAGPELKVSDSIGDCRVPSLVHNGSEYAASWQMGPTQSQVIQFRRFAP